MGNPPQAAAGVQNDRSLERRGLRLIHSLQRGKMGGLHRIPQIGSGGFFAGAR